MGRKKKVKLKKELPAKPEVKQPEVKQPEISLQEKLPSTTDVRDSLTNKISEIGKAQVQTDSEKLPLGNSLEQQMIQAENPKTPSVADDISQPVTEPLKDKKYTSKVKLPDGRTQYYYGNEPKKHYSKGEPSSQPVNSSQPASSEPVSSNESQEPQRHREDVVSVMIDGSIKPLIAWRTKVPIVDLENTPEEKKMLKNIQPEGQLLSKKSWILYFVVQGCLIIAKVLKAKMKYLFNPDGTRKEEPKEETIKEETKVVSMKPSRKFQEEKIK